MSDQPPATPGAFHDTTGRVLAIFAQLSRAHAILEYFCSVRYTRATLSLHVGNVFLLPATGTWWFFCRSSTRGQEALHRCDRKVLCYVLMP